MNLTDQQVRLGAAMMLLKRYGDRAPLMLANRIGELALEGDEVGIALWQNIARHMDDILRAGPIQ